MLNGHWHEFIGHLAAAGGFMRSTFPFAELFKIAVVALVTAVATSQVTLAELKGEIRSIRSERDILVSKRSEQVAASEKRRDGQVDEIKRDIDRIESSISVIQVQMERLKR